MAKSVLRSPITEAAIQRSAAGMIATFGRKAAGECQVMLEKMQQIHDADGEAVWQRILSAVETLQPRRPVYRPAAQPAANTEPEGPD
jgi:hypothetical protein